MGFARPHPIATRRAAEAMLRESTLSMSAIAAQVGVPCSTIRTWNARMAEPPRGHGRQPPPDLAALNAALRAHLGRQIAALDQQMGQQDAALDSGRALRDLAGLKRLLDDLAADAARAAAQAIDQVMSRTPRRAGGIDADGEADGESPQDLAALRADLARRYAAFEAARDRGAVPGSLERRPSEDAEP